MDFIIIYLVVNIKEWSNIKQEIPDSQKIILIEKLVEKMNSLNGCDYYKKIGLQYIHSTFTEGEFVTVGAIMDIDYNLIYTDWADHRLQSFVSVKLWRAYITFVFNIFTRKFEAYKIWTFPIYQDSFHNFDNDENYTKTILPQVLNNEPIIYHNKEGKVYYNTDHLSHDIGKGYELKEPIIYINLQNPFEKQTDYERSGGYRFDSTILYNVAIPLSKDEREDFINIVKKQKLHIYRKDRRNMYCSCLNINYTTSEEREILNCGGCIHHDFHFKKCKDCYNRGYKGVNQRVFIQDRPCERCSYVEVDIEHSDREISKRMSAYTERYDYLCHTNGGYAQGRFCLGNANSIIPSWQKLEINIIELLLSIKHNMAFADMEDTRVLEHYKYSIPRPYITNFSPKIVAAIQLLSNKYPQHTFSLNCFCAGCLFHKFGMIVSNTKYDSVFNNPSSYIVSHEEFMDNYTSRLDTIKEAIQRRSNSYISGKAYTDNQILNILDRIAQNDHSEYLQ